jgi:hypothetical protein
MGRSRRPDKSRGWRSGGMPGSRRSSARTVVPAASPDALSAVWHSPCTLSPYRRSPGSWGTNPTWRTRSAARNDRGSLPSTATLPRVGRRTPDSACNKVDFPEPFLPMSARTSPGMIATSTPSSAATGPYETASFRADAASTRSRGGAIGAARRGGVIGASRSRSGADIRRASRTERGSGSQPTSRPNSTRGGATGDDRITTSGVPSTSGAPPPGTRTIRSANGTTAPAGVRPSRR